MKLLCINNKLITKETPTGIFSQWGEGLVEGESYITRGKSYIDEDGDLCYYIEGLGSRLCCRFTELLDERSISEIAIEKLKEEFQLN